MNDKISLKNSKYSFEYGTLHTKTKISKLENENIDNQNYDIIRAIISDDDSLDIDKKINNIINKNNDIIILFEKISSIVDLKEDDICMIIVDGNEIEILESFENISELYLAWKSYQLRNKKGQK